MLLQRKTNQHSHNGLHTGHYDIIHVSETFSEFDEGSTSPSSLVVDDGSNKNLICGYVLLINGSPAILVSEQT
jgi:hypothetical protein